MFTLRSHWKEEVQHFPRIFSVCINRDAFVNSLLRRRRPDSEYIEGIWHLVTLLIYTNICLPTESFLFYLSIYVTLYLSIYFYIYKYTHPHIYLSIYPSSIIYHPYLFISIFQYLKLSKDRYICHSICADTKEQILYLMYEYNSSNKKNCLQKCVSEYC